MCCVFCWQSVDDIISLRLVIQSPTLVALVSSRALGRSIQLLQARNWKFKDAPRQCAAFTSLGGNNKGEGKNVSRTTPANLFHVDGNIVANMMTNANHT